MLGASPLVGDVQQIGVSGKGRVVPLALGHINALALRVGDELAAAGQVPLPPGGDHLDVRLQTIVPARCIALSAPSPLGVLLHLQLQ